MNGRLGRIQIEITDNGIAKASTSNIHTFSVDRRRCTVAVIVVDGIEIDLSDRQFRVGDSTISFERIQLKKWKARWQSRFCA